MKINALSGYNVYRKNGTAPVKAQAAPERAGKTDVVEFSRGQTSAPDQMPSLKASILSDIAQPTSPQKLAELKAAVQAGSYYRSTDELVNAILK